VECVLTIYAQVPAQKAIDFQRRLEPLVSFGTVSDKGIHVIPQSADETMFVCRCTFPGLTYVHDQLQRDIQAALHELPEVKKYAIGPWNIV
jgi:hypothetical protein